MTREQAVKAIQSHPQFSGLNHARVLRQATRIGRLLGLGRGEIVKAIFSKPLIADYSYRRNLAVVDAIRRAVKRSGVSASNRELFEWYLRNPHHSPYALEGARLRETILERKGLLEEPSFMGKKAGKWLERGMRRRHARR